MTIWPFTTKRRMHAEVHACSIAWQEEVARVHLSSEREMFAAAAMHALTTQTNLDELSRTLAQSEKAWGDPLWDEVHRVIARRAVMMADALVEALNVPRWTP